MLIHWIWLATRTNLSDRVKANLLQHFRDAEDIYYADADSYSIAEGLTKEGVDSL